MSNDTSDWSNWIITTIMAALTTMIGTVVALARIIESKYVSEVKDLKSVITEQKEDLNSYRIFADNRAQEMILKHEECMKAHHKAEIRIAQLETISNNIG